MKTWTYTTGGTLAPDAPSYVERQADKDLLASLQVGKFCYVLNSRQMGKSSLCVRTMGLLHQDGCHTAFVDLTKLGGKNVTPEQWYVGIANEIGRALGLRNEFIAYWKQNVEFSPVQRLFGAIREVALEKLEGPIAVFIDEIDATRSLSFSTDEFFAAIREGYNRRVQDPVFEKLTFCLLGVAVPSDLINSPTSTPFNIGERITLQDFTLEEAMPLAQGLGRPEAQQLLRRVHYWTNGQPYLTQSLCAAVAGDDTVRTPKDVDDMVSRDLFRPEARETNINLADVANRALHAGDLEPDTEKFRADLLSAYEKAWRGRPLADDESNRVAALLKLSGIMRSEGNLLKVRNPIYHRVFDRKWVATNMPGQELRRQKKAILVGVLRTSLVSLLIIALLGRLVWIEGNRAREAQLARIQSEHDLYVSKISNVELYDKEGDFSKIAELLAETKDSPYRGWEWGYWNAVLHDSDEEYALRGVTEPLSGLFSDDGRQVLIFGGGKYALVDRSSRKASATGIYDDVNYDIKKLGGRFVLETIDTLTFRPISDLLTSESLFPDIDSRKEPHYLRVLGDNFVLSSTWLSPTFDESKNDVIDVKSKRIVFSLVATHEFVDFSSVSTTGVIAVRKSPAVGLGVKLEFYQVATNKKIREFVLANDMSWEPKISPDGRLCAITDRMKIQLLSIQGIEPNRILKIDGTQAIKIVDFLDGGSKLLVRGKGKSYVVSTSSGVVERIIPNSSICSLSRSTGFIALGGNSLRIKSLNSSPTTEVLYSNPNIGRAEKFLGDERFSWLTQGYDIIDSGSTGLAAVYWPSRYQLLTDPDLKLNGSIKKSPGKSWEPMYYDQNLWLSQTSTPLQLWNVVTGNKVSVSDFSPPVYVGGGTDAFFCLNKSRRKLRALNKSSGQELWRVDLRAAPVNLNGTLDGSVILVSYSDHFEARNPKNGSIVLSIPIKNGAVGALHDGYYSVTAGNESRVYRKLERQPLAVLHSSWESINEKSVNGWGLVGDLSPDLCRAAMFDGEDSVKIVERSSGKRLLRITFPYRAQTSMRFTSDGSKLLVGASYRGIMTLKSDFHDPTTFIDVSSVPAEGKK